MLNALSMMEYKNHPPVIITNDLANSFIYIRPLTGSAVYKISDATNEVKSDLPKRWLLNSTALPVTGISKNNF